MLILPTINVGPKMHTVRCLLALVFRQVVKIKNCPMFLADDVSYQIVKILDLNVPVLVSDVSRGWELRGNQLMRQHPKDVRVLCGRVYFQG